MMVIQSSTNREADVAELSEQPTVTELALVATGADPLVLFNKKV
jgi:hypothetical protein